MDPEAPRHVALIVSYHGGAYSGFQHQPGRDTIQGRLERALSDLAGEPVAIRAAGRTDAGVHAAGQVVDAWLPPSVRAGVTRLPLALAARLPADIAVAGAWGVGPTFHARFSAAGKRYRYLIWRPGTASPFWRPFAWHYKGPLDVAAMAAAARLLEGRRDLTAFAGAARAVKDATRTVRSCRVYASGPWVALDVEADGFLYRMVRSMAGTLWRVGTGALTACEMDRLVAQRRRDQAGPSLPPHGLCLLRVRYPPEHGLPLPGDAAWPGAPGPACPADPFLDAHQADQ